MHAYTFNWFGNRAQDSGNSPFARFAPTVRLGSAAKLIKRYQLISNADAFDWYPVQITSQDTVSVS
jgi:hypothetical protein